MRGVKLVMPRLSLTLACGPYAHMDALIHDRVAVEDIDLTFLPVASPVEIFTRMLKNEAFDACEMSLSHYWWYGVEPNRRVLEVLAGYLHREYFVPKALNIDELFVPIVTASE